MAKIGTRHRPGARVAYRQGDTVIQRLVIDNWHPTKLNTLLHSHWAKAAKLKKSDAGVIAVEAVCQSITKATGKRRVFLEIMLAKGQRAGDPDAYWKSLLDGLVHCGLLVDDNRQYCEPFPPTFTRSKDKRISTTITLEDLDR